jgi:hypothetical protein
MTVDANDWSELLECLASIRREETDVVPLTIRRPPADESALSGAELRLGHLLDPQHRQLLATANGWAAMASEVTLLSAQDLGDGELWDTASVVLDGFYAAGPPEDMPAREAVVPVAVGLESDAVVVVWMNGPVTDDGHTVLWLMDGRGIAFANAWQWVVELVDREQRRNESQHSVRS